MGKSVTNLHETHKFKTLVETKEFHPKRFRLIFFTLYGNVLFPLKRFLRSYRFHLGAANRIIITFRVRGFLHIYIKISSYIMISLADTCMCRVKPPLFRVVYINLVFASGHGKVVESFNPRDSKGLTANLFI